MGALQAVERIGQDSHLLAVGFAKNQAGSVAVRSPHRDLSDGACPYHAADPRNFAAVGRKAVAALQEHRHSKAIAPQRIGQDSHLFWLFVRVDLADINACHVFLPRRRS